MARVPRTTLLLALLFFLSGCFEHASASDQPPPLPELPRIAPENFPPSIRDKVGKAYAAAVAHPRDASAVGQLGMVLQAYSQTDERAEVCYRRARQLAPQAFQWAYYLALVQSAEGKYPESIVTLQDGLRLNPRYLPAQLKLGEALLASGSGEAARKVYASLVQRHPESAQAYFGLGRAEELAGDTAGAIASFRKACRLFPDFGRAHYALGRAYQRLGQKDRAQEEFALSEQHKHDSPPLEDPLQAQLKTYGDPLYLLQLGIELAQQGKLEEAAAQHEEALRADPRLLKAHVNLISLYGRLQQFEKAEEHYLDAARLGPNQPEVYYNHGVLLLEEGKPPEAEAAFRKVLELNPRHADAHNYLGDLLQRQGRLPEAIAEFRLAVEAKPDFPQAHFNLGRALVNQGKFNEAVQELLKTLSTEDGDLRPTYLYAVGAAYARADDRPHALLYLHRAREQAAARQQEKLLESINHDLEILEGSKRPE